MAAPLSVAKPVLDRVLRDEATFANEDYAPFAAQLEINAAMFRRYSHPTALWDWRQMAALLLGDVADQEVLDFGCGMGEESIYLAKLGAKVTSIDISDVGIASLTRRAAFHKLDIAAYEMRCDPTSFPDHSFDRVYGMGILHHIGIEPGLAEVDRVLRPGGLAVFLEPMGASPTIEAVKTWLMTHARFLGNFDRVTDHEHNLTWEEVARALRRFPESAVFPYHLLYRLKRFLPKRSLDAVRQFELGLLNVMPRLRHFAGGVVIQVRKAP